jgi:hypothetical protein
MELRKSIQTFYKNAIESSSDEEAGDDTELMMAVAMLLHEHTSRPVFTLRGQCSGARSRDESPMSSAIVRRATTNSIVTTSILPTQSLMCKDSGAATRCQESCS